MLFVIALIVAMVFLDSPWNWVLVVVAAVVEVGELSLWVRWNRRRKTAVGAETLIGKQAVVVLPCRPEGQVRLDGELWQARCEEEGAAPGETVTVEGIRGLTLVVRRRS